MFGAKDAWTVTLLLLLLFAAVPRGVTDVIDSTHSTLHAASLPAAPRAVAAPDDSARSRAPVRTLPPVEVRRARALAEARRLAPTAFVRDLRGHTGRRAIESLSELVSEDASVRVVQYGGLGAFSTLSLRGAPPGQVSVFLDGVPLTSAAHGVANLSDLPVTAVERVEVYRSGPPLAYGAPTPGGAVNFVTGERPSVLASRVAGGSFGTWESAGSAGGARGPLSVLAHVGAQTTRGDFDYFDDNGTPQNPADDSTSTRRNNRFDAASALVRATWRAPGAWRVSAGADAFRRAQGLPGLGAVPAPHPRVAFERALGSLALARAADGRWPGATLRGVVQGERSRYRDTAGELGLGRQDTDERFGLSRLAFDAASPPAWPWLALAGGLSAQRERARPAAVTQGFAAPPGSRRATSAAWSEAQVRAAGERMVVRAARRWDRQTDHLRAPGVAGTVTRTDRVRELDAPQLGARLRPHAAFELRGNWSRSTRAPDFLELFGNQGSALGNPALAPEHAESWDAGLAVRGARGPLEASGEWAHYRTDARDLIVWQRNSQSSVRARNVSRADLHGEELSARLAWTRLVTFTLSSAWLSATDRGPSPIYRGKRLPQRPGRQTYARLDLARGRWGAALDALHLSDDFQDPANFYRVPARTLLGASLSARFGPARFVIEGKNLGDRRAADVAGFPLPGRSVFAACELRASGNDGEDRP